MLVRAVSILTALAREFLGLSKTHDDGHQYLSERDPCYNVSGGGQKPTQDQSSQNANSQEQGGAFQKPI
jgi:hypothetical protein